jgi:Ca2+-binding EF-hand superfamily protein
VNYEMVDTDKDGKIPNRNLRPVEERAGFKNGMHQL